MGCGSFFRAMPSPACGKTASSHSHRRTAHRASENVTVALPGHDTAPIRFDSGSTWQEDRDHGVEPQQARTRTRNRVLAPPARTSPGPSN